MFKSVIFIRHTRLFLYFLVLSLLILSLSITACSESTPSVSLGKDVLINYYNEKTWDDIIFTKTSMGSHEYHKWSECLKVVSFDKTDGAVKEMYGQKLYIMEFKAMVEIVCSPCTGAYFSGQPGQKYFKSISNKKGDGGPWESTDFKKGSTYEVLGKIGFEKTEKGWRAVKGISLFGI